MKPFVWPKKFQAAISLSFDDGMTSQLAVAVPMLDEVDLKGAFYLIADDAYKTNLMPWKAVADRGHEIGCHSVAHACSMNFPFISQSNRPALEDMTVGQMEDDIVEAKRRLSEVLSPHSVSSFAYPCYQPYVGRGATHMSYVPVVARHFVAGRGLGDRANDPNFCDLHYLWSLPCERMTGANMIGLVERTAAEGRWAILTFHGIHQGHLPIADVDLQELVTYLARNSERLWTAPISEVTQTIMQWRDQP
jgi:peptidoglycan/xylan/chitin deacetylase (PgdA/CDA1 family)